MASMDGLKTIDSTNAPRRASRWGETFGLSAMQLRGVDTHLIVALHALLSRQSVTRAAKDVGLSQSSMSHALARLRTHFDDPLLVQAGRGMVLTERARSLVAPVAEAISRLETVFGRPEPFVAKSSRRTFRVAATDNVELYAMPHLAMVLQKQAPNVDVRVTALPEDWALALLRGDIDLKLGRAYPVASTLRAQSLATESFAAVVRRGHSVSAAPTLREYAALDHLVVMPTSTGGEPQSQVDVALGRHGVRRRIALAVPHFLVAPFIVASSDLVLTAPERLLATFVPTLRLRRIELPVKVGGYGLSQVWAARASEDLGLRWLRDSIAGAFEPRIAAPRRAAE
jgi:DNA-binding transcriptional LysR family regulator